MDGSSSNNTLIKVEASSQDSSPIQINPENNSNPVHPYEQLFNDDSSPLNISPAWYYYLLSYTFGLIFFPITILGSWNTVNVNEEIIITLYGRYRCCISAPGLYFFCMWGNSIHRVNTALVTCNINNEKILDSNGAPLLVSAIVTYHIDDPIKATFQVHNSYYFIQSQAMSSLKRVSARYPYDDPGTSHSSEPPPSLRHDSGDVIKGSLCKELQRRVTIAGVSIKRFELVDMRYAPEIAKAMLARQEAMASLAARKIVVEGAVGLVRDSLSELERKAPNKKGLDPKSAARLACNIVTVLVGRSISDHVMTTSTSSN